LRLKLEFSKILKNLLGYNWVLKNAIHTFLFQKILPKTLFSIRTRPYPKELKSDGRKRQSHKRARFAKVCQFVQLPKSPIFVHLWEATEIEVSKNFKLIF
jgi:hypothetical protein